MSYMGEMKKYKNIIIYTLVFVILMILSAAGYQYLSKKYSGNEGEKLENSINKEQNDGKTNSIQSENSNLEKAKDFSVLNSNRREGEII